MTASTLPYRLGIDFGTSTTVAMLRRPDGGVRPLLFDGSPLLSSAVLLDPDGRPHTGRDAAHLARSCPERLEPNPKRRIDDGMVLLGDQAIEVPDLIAAVLRRVAAEARQVAGAPGEIVLSHPVAWRSYRRGLLVEAAGRAGLDQPRLVPEPVGAASLFARIHGDEVAEGGHLLVYDLGAGTCDATLLRRGSDRFEVVDSAGLDDVGGLDLDAAIVDLLRDARGGSWPDRADLRPLWDEVRTAKEMLSRASGTIVSVPTLGIEVPLGRAQFDELARPVLEPTVALVRTLLSRAEVPADQIAGLFLVGGSSRVPLVATMLHTGLGITPVLTEQPELVVAEGALLLDPTEPTASGSAPLTAVPTSPAALVVSVPPAVAVPAVPVPTVQMPVVAARPPTAGRPDPRTTVAVVATAIIAVLALLTAAAAILFPERGRAGAGPDAGASSSAGVAAGLPSGIGATIGSGQPSDQAQVPGRYRFADVGVLCEKVDVTPVKAIFEKQEGEPESDRSPGAGFGTASCILGLTHEDATGLGDSIVIVSFTLWIFEEGPDAVRAYLEHRDNAESAKAGPADEPGIGEQAFTYRRSGATAGPSKRVEYTLEVRDANLLWIAKIEASRIASNAWSQAQCTKIEQALLGSAKLSYARAVVR